MPNFLAQYKPYIKNRLYLYAIGTGVLILFIGIVMTFFAIIYATDKASAPVTDIILNNIPTLDVDGLFIWGPVIYWIFIAVYLLIREPKKIPFVLKSIGLFLAIRSFFLILTHVGPFPTQPQADITGVISVFTSGSDLFFSSHTGMPFLMALVFWQNKKLRNLSIAASIIFATIVLLGHYHYSIDVFAAFFITYAIFHIAEKFFKTDRQIFFSGLEN